MKPIASIKNSLGFVRDVIGYSFYRIYNYVTNSPFSGANYSRKRGYNPYAKLQSARADATRMTREELQKEARNLDKNSGLFNRLADIHEVYTVGSGLQVTPSSSDPVWNKKAKPYWRKTCRYIDLRSRYSLDVLESVWSRALFVDGGTFIILTYGEPDKDGRRRPRVDTYEAHLCKTPPSMSEREGVDIVDGVELDPRGRPIAYWFLSSRDGQLEEKYECYDADHVVHLYEPWRAGQVRELPMCTPVLNEFRDLAEIDALEMEAAKWAASRTDVIKAKAGTISFDQHRRERMSEITSTTRTVGGSAGESSRDKAVQSITGVQPILLSQNEDFQQYVSQRPSVVTREYYVMREEKACGGIGIPRILVYPDEMPATLFRGVLDMANSYFRARHLVIAEAVRRVYEHVMGWAIKNEPELFGAPADWYEVSIAQPRAVNVDVGRNSAAMLNELQSGATNLELIFGPLGLDWREHAMKLKEQCEFLKANGIVLPWMPADTTTQTSPPPKE